MIIDAIVNSLQKYGFDIETGMKAASALQQMVFKPSKRFWGYCCYSSGINVITLRQHYFTSGITGTKSVWFGWPIVIRTEFSNKNTIYQLYNLQGLEMHTNTIHAYLKIPLHCQNGVTWLKIVGYPDVRISV